MSVNTYECMFLLDTNKVSGDVPAAAKQLHTLLEKSKAEILASRPWDERRLSFPIKGHKKGLFYLTYVRAEGQDLVNLERDMALNEMILRSMVLRIPPKLVETMLTLAKDEHALALQSATEQTGMETGTEEEEGLDDHPRHRGRGRRPEGHDKD